MSTRTPADRRRLLDRLFVGGCTAAYVALMVSVAVALRYYAR
jgi:hypothetical protein